MRDIIKTALILTAICIVVTGALATTYFFTKDIIVQRTASDAAAIRATIIKADKYDLYDASAVITAGGVKYSGIVDVYKAVNADGTSGGWIITASSRGYSGPIQVVTGIATNGTITNTKISQITETPGLGMKALDAKFLSQLSGFLPKSALKTVKTPKTAPEQIEAISGATITSDAVVKAVNLSIDLAAELNKAKVLTTGGTKP
jgi:electron transport complex protein RnfG